MKQINAPLCPSLRPARFLSFASGPLVLLYVIFTICTTTHGVVRASTRLDSTETGSAGNFDLDTSFNATVTESQASNYVAVVQPDGKILVGGNYRLVNGVQRHFLSRLNSDGSIDPTFNVGGTGPNSNVFEIVLLPGGKILIGGFFSSYNGMPQGGIARLNPDGSLDTSFNVGGTGVNLGGTVQTISVQTDGKILITGNAISSYNGTTKFLIVRLNTDGSLDPSFTSPFDNSVDFVEEVDAQPDGKILICGTFVIDEGVPGIIRLNSDGSVDVTFDPGIGTDNFSVYGMTLQSDGKIIIGGDFVAYNGTPRSGVARINTDGSLDTSFVPPSFTGAVSAEYIAVQPDGKVLVAGTFNLGSGYAVPVVRFNPDGTRDFSLNYLADNLGYNVVLQTDGKFLLTGFFSRFLTGQIHEGIARFNADGTFDNSFGTSLIGFGSISVTVLQGDGKIIVGGKFRKANGNPSNNIARFNADGTFDNSFIAGSGGSFGFKFPSISALAVQSDGKILAGGQFATFNGSPRQELARLNPDGSLDANFTLTGDIDHDSLSAALEDIFVQADGKILIGGNFLNTAGTQLRGLYRLNSDGSVDPTFNPGGSGPNSTVYRVLRQPDGKFIIAGSFTRYNGAVRGRIARINADGTLDGTFVPGTGGNSRVVDVALQADGKLVIGGLFTAFSATPLSRVGRLNSDGTVDGGFNVGTGANNPVNALALEADGKVFVGGSFTDIGGTASSRFARLNTSGSVDTGFLSGLDNGLGPLEAVGSLLFQPDGKLLVGGTFTNYSGAAHDSLVRLIPPPAITGTVTYGNAVSGPTPPRFVSNVLISGAGSPNVSTTTSFPGGTFSLTGFGEGSYTVTPTKTGGVNNITSFDAARIAQHVAGTSLLTGNQLIVADVSNNGTISSFDAANIANFVVVASPAGSTGTWRFSPANRTYASITSDIAGQDYSALLMGEVSGNWTNSAPRPVGTGSSSSGGPVRSIGVAAPSLVTRADQEVVIPIGVQGIAGKRIIAYEFDLRYDPSVIRPQANSVDLTGTVSSKLSVAVGIQEAGLLRVAVYGPMPIDGSGVLLNLRFAAVGAPGSVSRLTWERIMFNEGSPRMMATDGQVELSGAPPDHDKIGGRVSGSMGSVTEQRIW